MSIDKLSVEACPFCGSEDITVNKTCGDAYCACNDCATDGPIRGSQDEAVTAWNTRAQARLSAVLVDGGKGDLGRCSVAETGVSEPRVARSDVTCRYTEETCTFPECPCVPALPSSGRERLPVEFENEDGWSDWIHPLPGYRLQCCDCGLIHKMQFKVITPDVTPANLNPGESSAAIIVFRAAREAVADEPTDAAPPTPVEPSTVWRGGGECTPERATAKAVPPVEAPSAGGR